MADEIANDVLHDLDEDLLAYNYRVVIAASPNFYQQLLKRAEGEENTPLLYKNCVVVPYGKSHWGIPPYILLAGPLLRQALQTRTDSCVKEALREEIAVVVGAIRVRKIDGPTYRDLVETLHFLTDSLWKLEK